ncbi:MAG: DMT family transporter [Steroidobacteraceae bacterium]|jgi:drug/metabolite transporter (DMT)-like permease
MDGFSSRATAAVVLSIALVGVSFGSIFVRLADAEPLAIAVWRMTLAAGLVSLPAWLVSAPRHPGLRPLCAAAAAGGLLALHFATWISSLQFTTVANSVLLVNTAPVFLVALLWLAGKRPAAGTLAGVGLAALGALILGFPSLDDAGTLLGNLLALAGAVSMAGYLLLAREAQRSLGYLSFVSLAWCSAAAVLWIAVLAGKVQWSGFDGQTWWMFAGLALVSQVIGHGGYNWSLRVLPPAVVAIALTGEPVVASLFAWLLLDEVPGAATLAGGALVMAAILLVVRSERDA